MPNIGLLSWSRTRDGSTVKVSEVVMVRRQGGRFTDIAVWIFPHGTIFWALVCGLLPQVFYL